MIKKLLAMHRNEESILTKPIHYLIVSTQCTNGDQVDVLGEIVWAS